MMSPSASITVNIMSYRYGALAAHAIESVLAQTKKPNVIRFFDDGAGDCAHLPDLYPEVEFILRPDNLGIIDNFNDALSRTKTEHVLFLGADNWLDEETLEITSQYPQDIVSYQGILHKETGTEYWDIRQAHGSSLYNVEKAKAVGGYAASGNEHSEEDSVLFNKMINSGASLEVVMRPLLNYRWRHRRNFNK